MRRARGGPCSLVVKRGTVPYGVWMSDIRVRGGERGDGDDARILREAVAVPARVDQVARVLGQAPLEVVERLLVDGREAVPLTAILPAEAVQQLLGAVTPRKSFRALEPMIVQAFERARGVEDVFRPMTIAVLKNRLIGTIGREFHESDYGVPHVRSFVRLFPALLRPVGDDRVPMVELIDPTSAEEASTPSGTEQRIRSDLWRASLDYASGQQYVWDPESQSARPASPVDAGTIVFPTLHRGDIAQWRAAFADTVEAGDGPAHDWAEIGAGRTIGLPNHHRAAWNRYQAEQVAAHVRRFFDLHTISEVPVHAAAPNRGASHPESPLRAYLHRYIDTASEAELARLQIDPTVALRLAR